MANSAWKRLEKAPAYGKAKLLARRLTGSELWLRPQISVETVEYGDWVVCPQGLDASSVVYSLGIGGNVDFDLSLIEMFGLEVHAFDPTPAVAEWLGTQRLPRQFHFYPWGVAAGDAKRTLHPVLKKNGKASDRMYTLLPDNSMRERGIEIQTRSLKTIMSRLGHDRLDILKMDIEGAEYEVLDGFLAEPCGLDQILVEFHHRFPGLDKRMTSELIDALNAIGYRIFAVSGAGREVSFLRR